MAFKKARSNSVRRIRTFDAPITAFFRRKHERTGGRGRTKDKPMPMWTQHVAPTNSKVSLPSIRKNGSSAVGLVLKKQQDRAEEINNPTPEANRPQTIPQKADENATRLQYIIRRAKEYWNK